jgi:hypothetical protein
MTFVLNNFVCKFCHWYVLWEITIFVTGSVWLCKTHIVHGIIWSNVAQQWDHLIGVLARRGSSKALLMGSTKPVDP